MGIWRHVYTMYIALTHMGVIEAWDGSVVDRRAKEQNAHPWKLKPTVGGPCLAELPMCEDVIDQKIGTPHAHRPKVIKDRVPDGAQVVGDKDREDVVASHRHEERDQHRLDGLRVLDHLEWVIDVLQGAHVLAGQVVGEGEHE